VATTDRVSPPQNGSPQLSPLVVTNFDDLVFDTTEFLGGRP